MAAMGQVQQDHGWMRALNVTYHILAMQVFIVIVLAHWVEHILQAVRIYLLGWARPDAKGELGLVFPWLVTSEWLHYAYALAMLVGLLVLRPALMGRDRVWWDIALALQLWHHFEHALLLVQAATGNFLFSRPVPTSFAQLLVQRVELHLFYNAVVFIPMLIATIYHMYPRQGESVVYECTCARRPLAKTP